MQKSNVEASFRTKGVIFIKTPNSIRCYIKDRRITCNFSKNVEGCFMHRCRLKHSSHKESTKTQNKPRELKPACLNGKGVERAPALILWLSNLLKNLQVVVVVEATSAAYKGEAVDHTLPGQLGYQQTSLELQPEEQPEVAYNSTEALQ